MRILYNIILVVIGVLLLAVTFSLIVMFSPAYLYDFSWSPIVRLFGMWLGVLILLIVIYRIRTRWLKNNGIYKSWSNFYAFMIENHKHPVASDEDIQEFIAHTKLPEKPPIKLRKQSKETYIKLLNQLKEGKISSEKHKLFVKCLISYMRIWVSYGKLDVPVGGI